MALKLRKWDVVDELKTEDDMALYLEAAMEDAGDDAAFIAKVLGDIAKAKGMTQLARDTGIGRESLYKALSGEGNPSFATILKVVHALGVRLHAAPAVAATKPRRASRRKPAMELAAV
ncbi:MAG: putative addiction module antidote protein [Rhodocyclaceae bacterium]|nr:putative addiction module antidote protein [Rhodocyclaceae bacterium]